MPAGEWRIVSRHGALSSLLLSKAPLQFSRIIYRVEHRETGEIRNMLSWNWYSVGHCLTEAQLGHCITGQEATAYRSGQIWLSRTILALGLLCLAFYFGSIRFK